MFARNEEKNRGEFRARAYGHAAPAACSHYYHVAKWAVSLAVLAGDRFFAQPDSGCGGGFSVPAEQLIYQGARKASQ